ncbi:MAG TPA: hypothetical protein VF053_14420 [Streptosporangiales bacterium]
MTNDAPPTVRFRDGHAGDAERVAALHAANWRRHYRGAFADSYLDGDVVADRMTVWSARLAAPGESITVLAEDDDGLAGFVHVILDEDAEWGSLVDNLHVDHRRRRSGIGGAARPRRSGHPRAGRLPGRAPVGARTEHERAAVLPRAWRRPGGACTRPAARRCALAPERLPARSPHRLAARVGPGR